MTALAADVIAAARRAGLMLTTAESCTGGMVAAALTDIAGASAAFERGFVTYSNAAKTELLGVPADLIATYGAVSEPVARAMAEGALAASAADIALSITGVAGPDGGTPQKPVGLVHMALAGRDGTAEHVFHFEGRDRAGIRAAATHVALTLLLAAVSRP